MARKKAKILIADNNGSSITQISRLIAQEGHQIYAARDGEEALRQAHRLRSDLIILEVALPKIDGWELCRSLRQMSDVPIMILTETATEDTDVVRGLELGADDYFFKPAHDQEILARIRALLRRSKLPPTYPGKANDKPEATDH